MRARAQIRISIRMSDIQHIRHIRNPILGSLSGSAFDFSIMGRRKKNDALISSRHCRPHHHSILIDTNLPVL